jgi:hypothetical protein
MRLPSSSSWKMAVNGIDIPPALTPVTDRYYDEIKS